MRAACLGVGGAGREHGVREEERGRNGAPGRQRRGCDGSGRGVTMGPGKGKGERRADAG